MLLACLLSVALGSCGGADRPTTGEATVVEGVATLDSLDPPARLDGTWTFTPGTSVSGPDPGIDPGRLLSVPGTWGRAGHPDVEVAWYRARVRWAPGTLAPDDRLALSIGAVSSAYELYVDGERIGGVAGPPPDLAYDRHATFPIPRIASADDQLDLALRVWRNPAEGRFAGGIRESMYLGSYAVLERASLWAEVPRLVLAALFVAFGLYHLRLFSRRQRQRSYLWLGLFLLEIGAYTLVRSQLRFALIDDFVLLKEIEHLLAFTATPLGFYAVVSILGWQLGPAMRLYVASHPLLGLVALAAPGLSLNLSILGWWPIYTAPGFLYLLGLVAYRAFFDSQPEARTMGVGATVMTLTFFWDQLAANSLVPHLFLVPYGTAVFAGSLAFSLADRFSRVHRNLDRIRAELEERVHERTRELDAARIQAEAANQAKGDFLANISHELRTPAHTLRRVASILGRRGLDGDAQRLVSTLDVTTDGLLALIEDLLTFADAEAGQLSFESEAVDPRAAVRAVVRAQRRRAEAKGLEFRFSIDGSVPSRVRTDPARLGQVAMHLVGNAVKFTERGRIDVILESVTIDDSGQLVAAASTDPEAAEGHTLALYLEVRDTGIGIAPSELSGLFQPFSQADTSSTRRHGGAGLGLVLSRRLVDALGGRIEVESEADHGSVFRLLWPVESVPRRAHGAWDSNAGEEHYATPHGATGTRAGARRATIEESERGGNEVEPSEEKDPADADQPDHDRVRVLVVDDDEIGRLLLQIELEDRGFRVETAVNGRHALERLEQSPFDLVLMDCQMPEVDGYEATRRLRRREAGLRHTPVVAVTAHAMAGDREKCLTAGMDDYLAKPYSAASLEEKLRLWLPAHGQLPVEDRS